MKAALLVGLASLLVLGGLVGLAAWSSAHPDERERELRWLEALVVWSEGSGVDCEGRFHEDVGSPPSQRLEPIGEVALDGCRRLRNVGILDLSTVRDDVLSHLTERRTQRLALRRSALLTKHAGALAGVKADTFCWPAREWNELSEEFALIRTDEFWLAGFADPVEGRIHLAPSVCGPLRRFFDGAYTPNLNLESYELAEALVTLAHEAEHLRSPNANEANVECVALQRVRELVRSAGRRESYGELMAGLAWEVGYPQNLPEYQTKTCRNGGPLDRNPQSDVWP